MNREVYEAPSSELESDFYGDAELAGRDLRLAAVIIDNIILGTCGGILYYLFLVANNMEIDADLGGYANFVIGILTAALFFIINGRWLAQRGQTIGKRVMRIKIATYDGSSLSFQDNIIPRYSVFLLLPIFPVIGPFLNLINVCCIFNKERRCFHDYVGKTKVIIS